MKYTIEYRNQKCDIIRTEEVEGLENAADKVADYKRENPTHLTVFYPTDYNKNKHL